MTYDLDHAAVSELLAVFVVDGTDATETETVERHLAACPRCRAELDGLREVVAALGTATEQPPEALWDRIHDRLEVPIDARAAAPMPPLVLPGPTGPAHPAQDTAARRHRAPRRRRAAAASLCALGVAAIVVIALLASSLQAANTRSTRLQALLLGPSGPRDVAAALATPGHRVVSLRGSTGARVADAIVVPGGHSVLQVLHLQNLSSTRTYQLWVVRGGAAVSLGVLGSAPRTSNFTATGMAGSYTLALTVEQAGGAPQPTQAPIATGTTSA